MGVVKSDLSIFEMMRDDQGFKLMTRRRKVKKIDLVRGRGGVR